MSDSHVPDRTAAEIRLLDEVAMGDSSDSPVTEALERFLYRLVSGCEGGSGKGQVSNIPSGEWRKALNATLGGYSLTMASQLSSLGGSFFHRVIILTLTVVGFPPRRKHRSTPGSSRSFRKVSTKTRTDSENFATTGTEG